MQPLSLPEPALSLSAHASEALLAVGTSASLHLASASPDTLPKLLHTHALPSVHATAFLSNTTLAASGAAVHAFDGGAPLATHALDCAAAAAVTALAPFDDHAFLAGDDDGGVHVFDVRARATAAALQQGDYIAALRRVAHLGTDAVLAASGDGTLCAYDVRRLPAPRVRLMYATDSFQDDLLSLAVVGGRAVAGTLSGALNVYDLRFLDAAAGDDVRVDRFFGHPECVNAVVPWEDAVVTASSDGIVRVVDVLGRQLLGVLGYEQERGPEKGKAEDGWPVEGMVLVPGWDRPVFALQGHDEVVRFCDGRALVDEEEAGEEAKEEPEEEMGKKKKKRRKSAPSSAGFFDDL